MNTKTLLLIGLLVPMAMSLPACNMMKGIGKDIHDMSQNVQFAIEGSEENKQTLRSEDPPSSGYRQRP